MESEILSEPLTKLPVCTSSREQFTNFCTGLTRFMSHNSFKDNKTQLTPLESVLPSSARGTGCRCLRRSTSGVLQLPWFACHVFARSIMCAIYTSRHDRTPPDLPANPYPLDPDQFPSLTVSERSETTPMQRKRMLFSSGFSFREVAKPKHESCSNTKSIKVCGADLDPRLAHRGSVCEIEPVR